MQISPGVLDVDDEQHMYILHMVFLPRINNVITKFTSGWRRHPLRTEGNKCPERLWKNGMIDLRNRQQLQVAEIAENTDESLLECFGFDPEAPTPSDDDLSQVELKDIPTPFTVEELQLLSQIDVLSESNNYGIDIFQQALEIIGLR